MPVEASPKKCARSFASMSEDDFLDDRDRVTAFDADAAVLRELVGKRLFFSSSSSSSSSNWTSDDV